MEEWLGRLVMNNTKLFSVLILFSVALCGMAHGVVVEGIYLPPVSAKALESALHPLAPEILASYVNRISKTHVFDQFAGQNERLAAEATNAKPLEIGAGFPVDMASEELVGEAILDGDWTVYLTAIQSVDAYGVRLQVDLSGLGGQDEVWVVDPVIARAFGPYTQADARDGGRWLATIPRDTAVLMVRTTGGTMPQVRLTGLSHLFRPIDGLAGDMSKVLVCNIDITGEQDAAIQEASTAVGLVMISYGYNTGLGSGSLINNAATPALEPYFLTANHVIDSQTEVNNTEIIWDYQTSGLDISELPRSEADTLLVTNGTLDGTLISLTSVPVGEYGRAYLGYDTDPPQVNEDVIDMHHPLGSYTRISYGKIRETNLTVTVNNGGTDQTYLRETKIGWDDGVTEGGSSGSTFLYASNLCIGGALTGGPSHICGAGPTVNHDFFSSFRYFYDSISPAYFPGIAPELVSFAVNNGNNFTTSRVIRLNNSSLYDAAEYQASELPDFSDAQWEAYSQSPYFTVSEGLGVKTIYFKVKNVFGESSVVADTITLSEGIQCFGGMSKATRTGIPLQSAAGDLLVCGLLLSSLLFLGRRLRFV